MSAPKVWVGTLYSGEGDFARCKEAIRSQKDVDVFHHTVVYRPEKEAHNSLWAAWRTFRDANPGSIFVKVDADTVLRHDEVLSQVVALFSDPRVTGAQCYLDDYFTAGRIYGLNCFSSRVVFTDTLDPLFCDRNVDGGHEVVVRGDDLPDGLKPAALHCHHSTPDQAFHFGVHRALKRQLHIIEAVKIAWLQKKDKARGMALLGAKASHALGKNHNYTDAEFISLAYQTTKDYAKLIKEL